MRFTFALVVGLLIALAPVSAAPAPIPPRERATKAEVVFDAGSPERVRLALIYLRSTWMLDHLAGMPNVSPRIPEGTSADRRTWLLSRLTLSVAGNLVTVKVATGHGEAGLAIAKELQKCAAGSTVRHEVGAERLVVAMRVKRWAVIQEEVSGDDEESVRVQFMMNPMKLAREARPVR